MTTTPHIKESISADEHTNDTSNDGVIDLATHVDLIEASMATGDC